ncbi:MAG TPA: hypothetical protein VES95_09500 [Dermatophilaceae bacterium]|nr:hypothetical protein [Dermatophilaceae bacterium]
MTPPLAFPVGRDRAGRAMTALWSAGPAPVTSALLARLGANPSSRAEYFTLEGTPKGA